MQIPSKKIIFAEKSILMQNKEMKIVYILPVLGKSGGAERIVTEKANYLTERFGYDVYIINMFQQEGSPYFYPLSKLVKIINLGIPYNAQYRYKYPIRLWFKIKINYNLRKLLSQTVNTINPDVLIGVSYSNADIVCKIPSTAKKIVECHEPKSLTMSSIFSGSIVSKVYAKYLYFRTIENKADIIVTLTKESISEWKKAKHVEVIPNFSTMFVSNYSDCEQKRIIAVGRLEKEKGYERLINIWEIISIQHPEWSLDIFGEGTQSNNLKEIISNRKIKRVQIHHATNDISKEYANSSICVLTSYFEGFALVLLEALKHGVPCIAFDCPYGPASIIIDQQCGFLIENGNTSLFTEKLNLLIENKPLRKGFSQAAIERAKAFDIDFVMKKWKELFENNCIT